MKNDPKSSMIERMRFEWSPALSVIFWRFFYLYRHTMEFASASVFSGERSAGREIGFE
jgi:hypothetical protein